MPHNRKTFYVLRALRLAIKQNFRQPGKIDFLSYETQIEKFFHCKNTDSHGRRR